MAPYKYGSHCITIRPLNGVDNIIESRFIKYAKKQDYALVVAEGKGHTRHLHMQFWYNQARELSISQRAAENNQKAVDTNWNDAAKKVCRQGVKYAYNDDFMNNYLSKDKEGHEILFKMVPKETRDFYPDEAFQDKAKVIKHAADKQLALLSLDYIEWRKDKSEKAFPNIGDVAEYLSYRMYTCRDLYVIRNRKKKKELCENLLWYTIGSCEDSIDAFIEYDKTSESLIYADALTAKKICQDKLQQFHGTGYEEDQWWMH